MSRNLKKLPLTQELSNELDEMRNYGSANEGEKVLGEKVKTIVNKINSRCKPSSLKIKPAKPRKTIEEQKLLAHEREKKALQACQSQLSKSGSDKSPNDTCNNEDLNRGQKNSSAKSRKTKVQPKSETVVKEEVPTMEPAPSICNMIPQIRGRKIQFLRPESQPDLYNSANGVKCKSSCDRDLIEQKNSCRQVNLKNSKLKVFTPRRIRVSMTDMTLGKPYGIQLGALNVCSEYFPKEVRNKQTLDVILVAHGMTYIKPSVHWSQQDVDNILMTGTELYQETRNVNIDKLSQLTKGFTCKNHFIQVTMSEPILIGKVMTLNDRSMDLLSGLQKFFAQHKQGILQTTDLDLYIAKRRAFFVFDPRGRTVDCVRSSDGESALMVFERLENVYHLILNLSKVNIKDPFKISKVSVTQFMNSKYSLDKFTAMSGNPSRRCRSDDYKFLKDDVAYLCGSIHLDSKVFGTFCGKQSLTTAIMALVYAKIDPPNSWATTIVDRVLHFGTKLYSDCLQDEHARNLTLIDIPSKFYVGDLYRAGVTIAPFLKRIVPKKKRLFCDDPLTPALRCLFKTSPFHCFLLQIDNYAFAIWQMRSTEVYYFFDGQQNDLDGNPDHYEGSSCLFMLGSIDKLCELVVKRLSVLPKSAKATFDIHGLKIIELTKLSEKEQKCKPRFRLDKPECIKPMTEDDVEAFEEPPSTVDSIVPMLTANEIKTLREKLPEKPEHLRKFCEDVVSSMEEKLSTVQAQYSLEAVELVKCIYSDIFQRLNDDDDDDSTDDASLTGNSSPTNCGKIKSCGC